MLKWYYPDRPAKKSDVLRKLLVFIERYSSSVTDHRSLNNNLAIVSKNLISNQSILKLKQIFIFKVKTFGSYK